MQKIPVAKVDLRVFNFIKGFSKKSRALDFLAVFCASYLGYVLIFILAVAAFYAGNWQMFFTPMLAGAVARFLLNNTVYFFYQRPRPVEVLPITALIKKPDHPAFPSGHASFFFALAFALFLFNIPLAIVATTAALCISLARIFAGVHWPSDIVGGTCSAGLSFFCVIFFQVLLNLEI